jgi:hypothetical protein
MDNESLPIEQTATKPNETSSSNQYSIEKDLTPQEANLIEVDSKKEAEEIRRLLLTFRCNNMALCPYVYHNTNGKFIIATATEFGYRPSKEVLAAINDFLIKEFLDKKG